MREYIKNDYNGCQWNKKCNIIEEVIIMERNLWSTERICTPLMSSLVECGSANVDRIS